jgi:hypothetical protein
MYFLLGTSSVGENHSLMLINEIVLPSFKDIYYQSWTRTSVSRGSSIFQSTMRVTVGRSLVVFIAYETCGHSTCFILQMTSSPERQCYWTISVTTALSRSQLPNHRIIFVWVRSYIFRRNVIWAGQTHKLNFGTCFNLYNGLMITNLF